MHPLVRYLRENGLTQRWLAAKIGVREQAVTTWVQGKFSPRLAHVQKIAELTGGAVPAEMWFSSSPTVVHPEHPEVNRQEEAGKCDDVADGAEQKVQVAVKGEPDDPEHQQGSSDVERCPQVLHAFSSQVAAAEGARRADKVNAAGVAAE